MDNSTASADKTTMKLSNRIPFTTLMYIAWRNLVDKKLRAFLTIFGVVIGIGAIYFLLSFGIGIQQLVVNEVIGSQSIKSIDVTSTNSKLVALDQSSVTKIQNLPHIKTIGASYLYAASITYNGSDIDAVTYGIDQNYQRLSELHLDSGRLLDVNDTQSVIISDGALKSIGITSPNEAIGKKIMVKIPLANDNGQSDINRSFTVAGVASGGTGTEIYISSDIFKTAGVASFNQLKIETDTSDSLSDARKNIESLGLQTASPADTLDQINGIFKFFNLVLIGFGAIGMVVAVLGMFNTLTISLIERTKEIGLMMALGARNSDIRKLFIFEATLLSVLGSLIGIMIAVIAGSVINLIMNNMAKGRGVAKSFDLFATPWWLTIGTIGFMVLVGLVVVYFPARRAARINPIDALRRE